VTVLSNYAYIADGDSGLRIINISNPAAPTEVGFYDTPGSAEAVTVSGDFAYVADGGFNGGLRIIDISDPVNPFEAGYFGPSAYDVAVSGSYAFVADALRGVRLVNISNPTAPWLVNTCDTPGAALGIIVAGSDVYVADEIGGLVIQRTVEALLVYLPLALK
jgi:hypothetical protein